MPCASRRTRVATVWCCAGGPEPARRPDGAFLVGVHCEDAEGANEAVAEGAHFLVVAPEDGPMAEAARALCDMVGRPVFAGWYPDARRLELLQLRRARMRGASG